MLILRKNIVMNSLKCLKQCSKRKLWLKIYLTTNMMCEKTNFTTRLKISFSFETMLETILTIVWLISFSMISKKSMFFEYVVLAMSFKFVATNEKKNKLIKHWVFVSLMKVMMLFERRKKKVVNLNDVKRFFAHFANFHVFWAFLIASNIAFRWVTRRIFRIINFLINFAFFQIWSVWFVFFFERWVRFETFF